jgi:dienelactone hydrolase
VISLADFAPGRSEAALAVLAAGLFFSSLVLGLVFGSTAAFGSALAADVHIASLDILSVDALRARTYSSAVSLVAQFKGRTSRATPFTYLASYRSDGLREYVRIDLPKGRMPRDGYPVVMFLHGWVGLKAAPGLNFYLSGHSDYRRLIAAFAEAGFAVLTPGFRGHGTVEGQPAEGIEYLAVWDNGTYLAPAFYAIDVLNLLEGLGSLEDLTWRGRSTPSGRIKIDSRHINVIGHSQGGDVALLVLAVCGAGSHLKYLAAAGSIWSGTFPGRLTQAATYNAVETTSEAFVSGDGTWNSTAIGADGAINENFIFGYPADWIRTPDVSKWTWQRKVWFNPSVLVANEQKFDEMYSTLNRYVHDIHAASYVQVRTADGKVAIVHDPMIVEALKHIGGFEREDLLTMPISLHHSDRDFYSWPAWNSDLCARVNLNKGNCHDFLYPGNTHMLKLSDRRWFSPETSRAGFSSAIARDVELFRGGNAGLIPFP